MGLVVLNASRVRDYADCWRALAREWAERAGTDHNPKAARLRHMAQMALYAAHEAEQLLARAEQRSRSGPYSGRRASRLG